VIVIPGFFTMTFSFIAYLAQSFATCKPNSTRPMSHLWQKQEHTKARGRHNGN
jgi:hypothetical protein